MTYLNYYCHQLKTKLVWCFASCECLNVPMVVFKGPAHLYQLCSSSGGVYGHNKDGIWSFPSLYMAEK